MFKRIYILVMILTVASTLFAQSDYSLKFSGNMNIPSSNFGDLYQNGYGGEVAFFYNSSDSWDFGLGLGYSKWQFDNNYLNNLLSGTGITAAADMPYSIFSIMAEADYFLTNGKFRPYLMVATGIHFAKVEANSVTVAGITFDLLDAENESVLGYKFGAGILYNISNSMGIDLQASYAGNALEFSQSTSSSTGTTTSTNSSNSTTLYLSIGAGIRLNF